MLVVLRLRRLVTEGGRMKERLVSGRTLAAVELCCGRRERIKEGDECKATSLSRFSSRLPEPPVNINKTAEF